MPGFYTKTPNGILVHINGDPNMPQDALQAFLQMVDNNFRADDEPPAERPPVTLSRNLARLRSAHGYGLVRACEAIGDIRPMQLSACERGMVMLPTETLERVAIAYGVTIDDLFVEQDTP